MPVLVNIGAPFVGLSGGDKNRARFLDGVLQQSFDVHHVFIEDVDSRFTTSYGLHEEQPTLHYTMSQSPWARTIAVFPRSEIERFREYLARVKPDVLFIRHVTATSLLPAVGDLIHSAKVVVDVDFLTSRIAQQAWERNRSLRNRYFLFAMWRNRRYERWLFQQPWLFLMSNEEELPPLETLVSRSPNPGRCVAVPNPMPDIPSPDSSGKKIASPRYILFHGVLDSMVNMDAFCYLAFDIYPAIVDVLEAEDAYIHVVGRGDTKEYVEIASRCKSERLKIVGEVDDMGAAISDAAFCIAPLRMGSGTKTRILETAAYGKAVVTTPIGVEGLRFDASEIFVCKEVSEIRRAVAMSLADPNATDKMGERLRRRSEARYSCTTVGATLIEAITSFET